MSAIVSVNTEITMPKLAGKKMSASTITPAVLSQEMTSFSHFHSNWAAGNSQRTSIAMATWSTRLSASDHQMTPRSFGSPSCRTASSKARIMSSRGRRPRDLQSDMKGPSLRSGWTSLRPYHAGRLELADLLGRESPLRQHFLGVLAALGGGALDALLGAREARRRCGLREAQHVDIGAARLGVRML